MILQSSLKPSNWPFLVSLSIFNLPITLLSFFSSNNIIFLSVSLVLFLSMLSMWFKDLLREAALMGYFNLFMQTAFKMGMILFIFSEIMFFFSIFWSYFHFMLMFSGETGFKWPGQGVPMLDVFSIPLLNTILLLSSGASMTISHNYKLMLKLPNTLIYLSLTLLIGTIFTLMQLWEYYFSEVLFSDSAYGAVFYLGTGFHGTHVLIGSIMLSVSLYFLLTKKCNNKMLFFDLSSWYWHFVDMVWILLYCEFYWWPLQA